MRVRGAQLVLLAGMTGSAVSAVAQAAPAAPSQSQTSQAKSETAPLAPIAWMAGSWAAEAKEPGSDKPPAKILSRFTPQMNGRTMTIETSFEGKLVYQGMFAFDPAQKAIAFWYVTPEGESIKGTVEPKEAGDLLFDFQMTLGNGVSLHFQTVVHRVDADHYTWTLFTNSKGATWEKLLAVDYHRVP